MFGEIGELAHHAGIKELPKRIVDGLKFQIDEFVVERGNAAPVEPVAKPIPGLLGRGSAVRANRERRGTGRRGD